MATILLNSRVREGFSIQRVCHSSFLLKFSIQMLALTTVLKKNVVNEN